MSRVEGRIEKRIRVPVPVELAGLNDPASTESTQTENVCSAGVRVITRRLRKPNEQLQVTSSIGRLKEKARVVYCQPLRDRSFALGLQFERLASQFAQAARDRLGAD